MHRLFCSNSFTRISGSTHVAIVVVAAGATWSQKFEQQLTALSKGFQEGADRGYNYLCQ